MSFIWMRQVGRMAFSVKFEFYDKRRNFAFLELIPSLTFKISSNYIS